MSDLRDILRRVATGELSPDQAADRLKPRPAHRPQKPGMIKRAQLRRDADIIGAEYQRLLDENDARPKWRQQSHVRIRMEIERRYGIKRSKAEQALCWFRYSVIDYLLNCPGATAGPHMKGVAEWARKTPDGRKMIDRIIQQSRGFQRPR